MKTVLDNARAEIARGLFPKNVLAENKKTGHSVCDNVPQLTCYGACPIRRKCYDVKILKLRPNVLRVRALRHFYMETFPIFYAEQAIAEIVRLGITKVRVYGGGDYAPHHLEIIQRILTALPNVTLYMISKTIRAYPLDALILLSHENFFLNISECKDYHFGEEWVEVRAHPRVNSVYTLLEDDTDLASAKASDIVFNVSKKAASISLYKEKGLPLCPCDAHDIPADGACAQCNLCSTKGGVAFAALAGAL